MKNFRYPINLQLFSEEAQTVNAGSAEVAAPPGDIQSIDEGGSPEHVDANGTQGGVPEIVDQDKPKQSPEMDAHFAKLRREKEQAERSLKQMDDWVKTNFGSQGINTWAEYQQALEKQWERQMYEEKGIDPDAVEEIIDKKINSHPDVIRAKNEQVVNGVNTEIDELNQEFPDLKIGRIDASLPIDVQLNAILEQMSNADKVRELVIRGYSLADAYYKANKDDIRRKQQEATLQAARNNMDSKNHIKPSGGEGGDVDATVIPPETLAMYRQTFKKQLRNGTMTEKDFVKHYQQSMKNTQIVGANE